jgi:hypothetical protein
MRKVLYTLPFCLMAATLENRAKAAGEVATVVLTSQINQCEGEGDNEECEHLSVPKVNVDVPLELMSSGEGSRLWVGTFEDRREIGGFSVLRRGMMFRVYSTEESGVQVNTVSAFQILESENEQKLPPIVTLGVKNVDDMPITTLSIPPVKRDGKTISSQLMISGRNTSANSSFTKISPNQNNILSQTLQGLFLKK